MAPLLVYGPCSPRSHTCILLVSVQQLQRSPPVQERFTPSRHRTERLFMPWQSLTSHRHARTPLHPSSLTFSGLFSTPQRSCCAELLSHLGKCGFKLFLLPALPSTSPCWSALGSGLPPKLPRLAEARLGRGWGSRLRGADRAGELQLITVKNHNFRQL